MIELDSLSVEGKRKLITAACIIGLILSNVTFALRIWAKKSTIGVLHPEDWFMLAAVLLSYSFVACEFYGISVGLGEHEANVTKADLRQLNLSIWIIQRFQPPAIFCIKTSIILLYVRIFQTAKFKKVAWGIWIYTLLWTIGAWLASTFECTPVAFFWDKTIKGGHCVNNALTTVGFTDGFLSFLGDLFILCMPLPMVWKLHMNTRGKLALSGIFLFGLFVVGTSIIRLIALFGIDTKDVSFTQVQGGIWTYLEVSIGITCGNLPLLRPLFRRFFDATSSAASKSNSRSNLKASDYARGLGSKVVPPGSTFTSRGFERMENDVESLGGSNGSEVELQDRRYKGDGIKVDREVELRIDSVDAEDVHNGNIGGGGGNGRRRDNGMRTDVRAL